MWLELRDQRQGQERGQSWKAWELLQVLWLSLLVRWCGEGTLNRRGTAFNLDFQSLGSGWG